MAGTSAFPLKGEKEKALLPDSAPPATRWGGAVWPDAPEGGCSTRRRESKHCLIKTWVPARFLNHLALILADVRSLLLITTGWWGGAAGCRRFSPNPSSAHAPSPQQHVGLGARLVRRPGGPLVPRVPDAERLVGSVLSWSWAVSARQRCDSGLSLCACLCVMGAPHLTGKDTEARKRLARSPVPDRGRVRVGRHRHGTRQL